jgi:hypothetical protein
MSAFSHLEMSCFGLGMLAGSLRDYGAGHACSHTGDIEHARTRPSEGHPGHCRHGPQAWSRGRAAAAVRASGQPAGAPLPDRRDWCRRGKAAACRYFEKAIDRNGEPKTTTVDKSGANLAALEALNADRPTPIKVRQSKYLNNVVEVRHEVAYRSCSPFSPYRRSEPPVSPGESRGLNQERL